MKKYDLLLKRVEQFERLAVYGDRQAFLQALAQAPSSLADLPTSPRLTELGKSTLDAPVTQPNAKTTTQAPTAKPTTTKLEPSPVPAPTAAYGIIPIETQDQLNKLLVPTGDIMPLKLDGKIGDLTRKALEAFKKRYHTSLDSPSNIAKEYALHQQIAQSVQ